MRISVVLFKFYFFINNSIKYFIISSVAKAGLEIAKEGIDTVTRTLDLYTKILDNVIPLKKRIGKVQEEFKPIFKKLNECLDASSKARQSVSEWCLSAVPLLSTYGAFLIGPINQYTYGPAQAVVIKVYDSAIDKFEKGQKSLGDSSSCLEDASNQLTLINQQQKSEKKPESIQKYYHEVTEDVINASLNIDDTKGELTDDIRKINYSKNEIEGKKTAVELDNTIELKTSVFQAAKKLIEKCVAYQGRHIFNV